MIAQTIGRDGSIWLLGRLSSDSVLPNIGMTMQVRYRQNCRDIGFHNEEHSKREAPQNGSAKFVEDEWIALWAFFNSCERGAKFSQELQSQAIAFAVIPRCRFKGIEFCLRPNVEPGHLLPSTQTLLNPVDDFAPWPSVAGRSTMSGQAFLKQNPLPFLERHLIDSGCDAVPERLHVVDLLFNRKRVEPWGRQRQGWRHARTIPPASRLLGSSSGNQDWLCLRRPNARLQPQRLMIPPAADGCKPMLGCRSESGRKAL